MFKSTFLPLLLASYAAAHGYVAQVTINGKSYTGNVPNADPNPSIIRQIFDVGPVKGADNKDINCGINAQLAQNVASANPGDEITFDWRGGDGSKWPHNTGPMLTYMASCGSTTCDKFDSTKAKWFKIQQVGRKAKGQEWAQADLMQGAVAKLDIPATLAPGNYLIRHEIIALHLAETEGGAEFYPSCTQLTVGGNQNGKPQDSELVTFPGAYSDTDPGILDTNAFDANANYDFPGPQIASFVQNSSGSSNGNGGSTSASATATSSGSRSTSTGTAASSSSTPSTGKCQLKKRVYLNKREEERDPRDVIRMYRPKHISRIMRNLLGRDGFGTA